MPDKGRTVIEKFLQEAEKIRYAFVLLTPDEDLKLNKKEEAGTVVMNYLKRDSQYVIFELGFFIGRLGRERVCCLYKQGVELPSDYSGVLYKPFRKSVEEAYSEIRKDLVTAGYKIADY